MSNSFHACCVYVCCNPSDNGLRLNRWGVPGTLHGQPAKFKLKIPDPDTERPTAEPKTKPKLEVRFPHHWVRCLLPRGFFGRTSQLPKSSHFLSKRSMVTALYIDTCVFARFRQNPNTIQTRTKIRTKNLPPEFTSSRLEHSSSCLGSSGQGSAQKVVTGPKGCAGKKALMDPKQASASGCDGGASPML